MTLSIATHRGTRGSLQPSRRDWALAAILGDDAVRDCGRLGVTVFLHRTTRAVSCADTAMASSYQRSACSVIGGGTGVEERRRPSSAQAFGSRFLRVHTGHQARYFHAEPRCLPAFAASNTELVRLHIPKRYQPLDMIREGFDCILRP